MSSFNLRDKQNQLRIFLWASKRSFTGQDKSIPVFILLLLTAAQLKSQQLGLKEAVQVSLNNYGTIKAKASYLKASRANVKVAEVDYLPNLSLAAQQAYGTANGQFGPQIANGGLTTASSGPPLPSQNWKAAFGGLYLANINWDFFTFGRVREKIKLAQSQVMRDSSDLMQEKFQHSVRVAGAYLNLLAAQRIRMSQQRNLDRANALRTVVVVRAKNGLNPGVDSSLANAEVSSAAIALTNAIDYEQAQSNQLSQLMGVPDQVFQLDSFFINRLPIALYDSGRGKQVFNPILQFYKSRIEVSRQQEKYYTRMKYPALSLVGVLQGRGSGFTNSYNETHPDAYTHNYLDGINPVRSNYLLGVGISWNVTNVKRVNQQVAMQQATSEGLQNEYELIDQQVKAQLALADKKITNALANFKEAPAQVKAASDAYLQKSVLYKNGLANIVDITQALYTLNRAETDRDISNNNVWQALLFKAAASGDFGLFANEF